jgi:hypothetical protein
MKLDLKSAEKVLEMRDKEDEEEEDIDNLNINSSSSKAPSDDNQMMKLQNEQEIVKENEENNQEEDNDDNWTKIIKMQMAMHGQDIFNILLKTDEGYYFSKFTTWDETEKQLKIYFDKGFLNTGGKSWEMYVASMFKPYLQIYKRNCYLIYCSSDGENKIMGIPDLTQLNCEIARLKNEFDTDPVMKLMKVFGSVKLRQ